jgi:Na+/H+ antiporter NhaA
VSLFVTQVAFDGRELADMASAGVIVSAAVAGVVAFVVLRVTVGREA